MQKIWIIGSSGSGKTTLANKISKKLSIPVYHSDKIFWKENWQERPKNEQIQLTKEITKCPNWIYEGNRLTDCKLDGRFNYCDIIIHLDINRFICVYRFIKRYLKYKGTVRPDISNGCIEKIDFEVIKYIVFDYPKKKYIRQKLLDEAKANNKKVIILSSTDQINKWIKTI